MLLRRATLAALLAAHAARPALGAQDPWTALWNPDPSSVRFSSQTEVDGAAYSTITTRRFVLYYPARLSQETDRQIPLHVAARLDGLYDFLSARWPTRPATPVKAFLVEGARGARTFPETGSIRVGIDGTLPAILGSLFHELVHLFNFSVPGASQDFWSGELFAQYHADRLRSLGLDHQERYRKGLGVAAERLDWSWIGQLDRDFGRLSERERWQLMEMGVSIYYYLEDRFGAAKTSCLQRAHLDPSSRADPGLWDRCFGESEQALRSGWRAYYGLR